MIIAFMKRYICILAAALSLSSCYDRDVNVSAPAVGQLENIDYQIDDGTLGVYWSLLAPVQWTAQLFCQPQPG